MAANEKIQKQVAKLAKAKSDHAVQAEVAPDQIERSGVTFYKPNMAAIWFYNRLKMNVHGFASLADFGICLVYACSLDQKGIRNIAMPAISKGEIVDKAYSFMIENELTEEDVNDVLEEIWNPVLNKDGNTEEDEKDDDKEKEADSSPKPQGSSPSGGAES